MSLHDDFKKETGIRSVYINNEYNEEYVFWLERKITSDDSENTPCATETCGTQPTDVQQLKPKMPSYRDFRAYCRKWYISVPTTEVVYRYFARHFGR